MRVISWNVNGLRAAARKGFLDWLAGCRADLVLLQEVKAHPDQLPAELRQPPGWQACFHAGERRGYSGVAAYWRRPPDEIVAGLGVERFDHEGRVVQVRYGELWVLGCYFPNGGNDLARVPFKLDFYAAVQARVRDLRRRGGRVVVGGDFNTAHRPVDLARPRENVGTSGFLPEERAWLDAYVEDGLLDSFRLRHPGAAGRYSWWTYRAGARARNVGWRIDYHFVDAALADEVRAATIHPEVEGSDHCPVGLVLAE